MRIVSFGYFAPYAGVPHAGGEYYLRHVSALLASGHEVVVVAPATADNLRAVGRTPAGMRLLLVDERRSVRTRAGDRVVAAVRHAVPPTRFTAAVLRDHRVMSIARSTDLIEYQWVQMTALAAPLARRLGRRVPTACIAHDVLGQALRRQASQPGLSGPKRALRVVRAALGEREERRNLRDVDLVLTFSDKDRRLLAPWARRVEAVDPPLADGSSVLARREVTEPRVLFVGAFDRIENYDAAHWLLDDVWPRVLRERPDARLDLVGANPSERMTLAADHPALRVSGYVEDLEPWYRTAAVALVPLRMGAGVKFKVVAAMLHGLPVVTTTVGAEGIADADSGVFAAVVDDPSELAREVVAVLDDRERADRVAARALPFAAARYGTAHFRARLDSLYRDAVGVASPAPSRTPAAHRREGR